MNLEFKKRLMTTLLLIPSMILMYINSYFFILAIFMISMIAILEFIKLMSQIFKKKSYLILFFSIVASIYILLFSIIFYDLNTLSEVNNLNSLKRYIWYMLLTCIASDIGGYLIGKSFKGPKLTKLSPNKTISGSLGSFIFSIVLLSFLMLIENSFNFYIILLAFITSLGCQVGDIFFSFLKRKAKVKDTGNLLPGHGGILDRIDGILFGIPFGILGMWII